MIVFRIHFADGQILDVDADNRNQAREMAKNLHPGIIIKKIKVVKERADA